MFQKFVLLLAINALVCYPGCNGIGFWTYFTDLFNMHKIQPVREYTLYGTGNQETHVDVDSTLPQMKPPKDVEISQAIRDEIMANRERLRESQALAHSQQSGPGPNPNIAPTFSRSGFQPPHPRFQRNQLTTRN